MTHINRDKFADALKPHLGGRSLADCENAFEEQGYIVFENVIGAEMIDRIHTALAPHFDADKRGRNNFEGHSSHRVYALMGKDPVFPELATHPLPLAFAEADLGETCLLSAFLAIRLLPGETVQPWHHDDGTCALPRPRPSLHVSAFWAVDDTTEENGATEVLPASHKWSQDAFNPSTINDAVYAPSPDADDPHPHPDRVKVTMPAGSLMLAKGLLWHRGGANKSQDQRLILTPQYCPGWVRQLENMVLATPKDAARAMDTRARELLGYNIMPPFMGYVDGVHPQKTLGIDA